MDSEIHYGKVSKNLLKIPLDSKEGTISSSMGIMGPNRKNEIIGRMGTKEHQPLRQSFGSKGRLEAPYNK